MAGMGRSIKPRDASPGASWRNARLFSLRPHARGGVNNNGAGRSSGFRIIRSVAPSHHESPDGDPRKWRCCDRSSPITAAGPRWTCTIFPLIRPTRGGPAPRTIHLSKLADLSRTVPSRVNREAAAYANRGSGFKWMNDHGKKKCGTHRLPSVRPAKPFGINLRLRSTRPLITLPRSAASIVERSRRLTPRRHHLGAVWGISLFTRHSRFV